MKNTKKKLVRRLNIWKRLTQIFLFVIVACIIFLCGLTYNSLSLPAIPFTDRISLVATNILPYSGSSCPDFNAARTIMKKSWKDIGYGYAFGPFMSSPFPPEMSIDDMGIQSDMGYNKWRFADGEPYSGFVTEGEWEYPYLKQSVKQVSDGLYTTFVPLMTRAGFEFSKPNDVPYYLYPDGKAARKIVFTKNGYVYHFFIYQYDKDQMASMFSIDEKILSDHPATIKMTCAKNDPRIRAIYQKRFEYPHAWTNETSVLYLGKKDNLITFELQYPGTSTDQSAYEYWATYGDRWELIGSTNNFLGCSLFQNKKVGKGTFCYLPNNKEFTTVDY